ncbi:unnamed protein product [Brachionus calyciflorus]|uniref:Uncharacterized protein n=1 Tax=Brachionus calyciflorus TaxID=104777 RepID=A0A814HEK1_9BILA|nr:unnamed protein product [Brachionus calyciflorus]
MPLFKLVTIDQKTAKLVSANSLQSLKEKGEQKLGFKIAKLIIQNQNKEINDDKELNDLISSDNKEITLIACSKSTKNDQANQLNPRIIKVLSPQKNHNSFNSLDSINRNESEGPSTIKKSKTFQDYDDDEDDESNYFFKEYSKVVSILKKLKEDITLKQLAKEQAEICEDIIKETDQFFADKEEHLLEKKLEKIENIRECYKIDLELQKEKDEIKEIELRNFQSSPKNFKKLEIDAI